MEIKLKGHLRTLYKTRVVKKDLFPIWNESYSFIPSNPDRDIITLTIWDHDTLTPDDFLGKISIPVRQYLNRGPVDEWLILTNKKNRYSQGELHVQVQYGTYTGAPAPSMYPQQQMYAQPAPYPQQMPYNPQAMPQQYVAPPYPPAQMPPGQGYPMTGYPQAQPMQQYPVYPSGQGTGPGLMGTVNRFLNTLNRF